MLGRNVFEQCHYKLPVFGHTGYVATFKRCVGRAQGGAEAHHVHFGVDASDDAALQTGVYHLHRGCLTKEIGVNALGGLDNG